MEERDFNWCYNHENLFRRWVERFYDIDGLYADKGFDSDSIFSLWQEAKKYALQIANSEEPGLLYRIKRKDIKTKMPDNFCYIMQFLNFMLMSTKGNIMNSIFYNCSNLLETYLSTHKVEDDDEYAKIVKNANDELFLVWGCSDQINSDYDYSLPDGGIKDETETDETITKTIMKTDAGTKTITDETITKTITKTDGSVTLPAVLDTNEFKKYLSLAKEKGLIKDVDGKLEWIQIGDRSGSSQLAYFLGRVFGYKHSVNGNIGNEFPGDELDELFGVKRIYRLLVQVHSASKPQKWRRKIDELFE